MAAETMRHSLRRILVVKLADLGDAVLATPAIRALRAAYPEARIDALTTPGARAIFTLCPSIDRIIDFPKDLFDQPAALARPDRAVTMLGLAARLRAARYDAVVLLHHLTTRFGAMKYQALLRAAGAPIRAGLDNGAGGFLTHAAPDFGFGARPEWRYALDIVAALGAMTDDPRPSLAIPDQAHAAIERQLDSSGIHAPFVVIHAGVGGYSAARQWPSDRFAQVAAQLQASTDLTMVAVGTPNEAEGARPLLDVPGVVDLIGKTSVAELAALVRRSALTIGADSGVVHLAAALGAPTLAIFGPSNQDAWRPFGAEVHQVGTRPIPPGSVLAIRAGIPCSPCFYTGYTLGRREGCERKTCLDLVTSAEVAAIGRELIRRGDKP